MSNWLHLTVGDLEVQALAFVEPSKYGMVADPRISKLHISATLDRQPVVLYHYDRGETITDRLDDERFANVVTAVAAKIR